MLVNHNFNSRKLHEMAKYYQYMFKYDIRDFEKVCTFTEPKKSTIACSVFVVVGS